MWQNAEYLHHRPCLNHAWSFSIDTIANQHEVGHLLNDHEEKVDLQIYNHSASPIKLHIMEYKHGISDCGVIAIPIFGPLM